MSTESNDPKTPSDDGDVTRLRPEDSIRVAEIRAALVAEMREARESNANGHKPVIENVQDLKDSALNSLRHVMDHSPNESLKARVSMWTIDKILEAEKANDDPMAEFLKSLPPVETTNPT